MTTIRSECLVPHKFNWEHPTSAEMDEVLRLAGLTVTQACQALGLKDERLMRKWVSAQTVIPYASWALLCELAGLGRIWSQTEPA
jgi:hypothetical protein